MNMPRTFVLTLRFRIAATAAVLLLGMLAMTAGSKLMLPAQTPPSAMRAAAGLNPINPLMHWRERGHHWLVVTDQARHQRVLYDADSGRPLGRAAAGEKLGQTNWQRREAPLLDTATAYQRPQASSTPLRSSLASR